MFQIYDGTTTKEDNGDGITLTAAANTEYAFRYYLKKGLVSNGLIFTPTITAGIHGLRTFFPQTAVWVVSSDPEEQGVLTAEYPKATLPKLTDDYAKKLLTLGFLTHHKSMKPRVVFIDDDTTSLALVQRYHTMLNALNARGNFAVITSRLIQDDNLKTELLSYETEGYGMLFHCQIQSGAEYFMNDNRRNLASIRNNLVTGIREMHNFNFADWKHWVTPYGVNDPDIQMMAKEFGFDCLLSNDTQNFIRNYGDCSRWNLPRVSLGVNPSETARFEREKAIIDAAKATDGLVIFTTHVNNWPDNTNPETKFEMLVNYINSQGVEISSFAEAFNERLSMFHTTEAIGNLL